MNSLLVFLIFQDDIHSLVLALIEIVDPYEVEGFWWMDEIAYEIQEKSRKFYKRNWRKLQDKKKLCYYDDTRWMKEQKLTKTNVKLNSKRKKK